MLHKERVVFDGIYKKLEYDLHKKKKEMAAIIEDSKNAQRARIARKSRTSSSGRKTRKKHLKKNGPTSARSWSRTASCKRRCGGKARGARRKTAEALAASKKAEEEPTVRGPEESERRRRSRPVKKKVEKTTEADEEEVQEYQATFERITKATGIQTVEELVDTFQDIEQKNFSLLTPNELNSDIEATELAIAKRASRRRSSRARASVRTRSGSAC